MSLTLFERFILAWLLVLVMLAYCALGCGIEAMWRVLG